MGKLNIQRLRYQSKEEMRVLTAVCEIFFKACMVVLPTLVVS
jgi:hypothetical protein